MRRNYIYKRAICIILSCALICLTACGKNSSGTDGTDNSAADSTAKMKANSGTFGEAQVEETSSDSTEEVSVYGSYDAVAASVNGEEEVWIEPGEYLIVNEDDSLSMYVAEQNLEFATSIKDNKFYLNGNTKVGEINTDGSITLNLNDDVQYVFAKEGSSKWSDWQSAMGITADSSDIAGSDNIEESIESDDSDEEPVQADYDFDEALKLVGDYEGIIIFKEAANFYGKSFDGIPVNAFVRIVIDENKKPKVFIRHMLSDSVNFENISSSFRDDGTLELNGALGSDDGPANFISIVMPPVLSAPLNISGTLTSDFDTKLFEMYLKPLNSSWDYSYLDDDISNEDDFDILVNNLKEAKGDTLEEKLNAFQAFWDENNESYSETFTMITDELPDPELLTLYE